MKKLLTAICFFSPKEDRHPLKYRNINNVEKFIKFVEPKGVLYINFYNKETREFVNRHWIKEHK